MGGEEGGGVRVRVSCLFSLLTSPSQCTCAYKPFSWGVSQIVYWCLTPLIYASADGSVKVMQLVPPSYRRTGRTWFPVMVLVAMRMDRFTC